MRNIKFLICPCFRPVGNEMIETYMISPVSWMLRLNHETDSQSKNDYKWLTPWCLLEDDSNDLQNALDLIEKEKIDVFCFSVYVWNRKRLMTLAEKIKKIHPHIITIVGGPDIDAHINKNFFPEHPYLDWAMYGEGEIAFSFLLDHIAGYDVDIINVVDKRGTIHPHQVFMDKNVLKKSPYLEYQDEIRLLCKNLKKELNGSRLVLMVWETTKGCPYTCTFCDWSSGLHHKVRIWGKGELEANWKKELALFTDIEELEVIFWTNPNIGLTPQDPEIVEYWCNLFRSNPNCPRLIQPQWSKSKKDQVYQLMEKFMEAGLITEFKVDLQDLDTKVLEYIERPEMPWAEHKPLLAKAIRKYYEKWNVHDTEVQIFFIWGLPGQNFENMKRNMIESGSIRARAHTFLFEILPLTPAAVDEYKQRFKLEIQKIIVKGDEIVTVVSNSTMDKKEWFTGTVTYYLHKAITQKFHWKNIIGKEDIFFKNFHKFQSVIDESYEHFLKTNNVQLIQDGKAYDFKPYVKNNLEYLHELFFEGTLLSYDYSAPQVEDKLLFATH
jgi:putative methyltransferase